MNPDHKTLLELLFDVGELAAEMADDSDLAGFLESTAVAIAHYLDADVCSIYLFDETRRALVLHATTGLNPEAVGRVQMKPGEGLVGRTFAELEVTLEACASRNPHFKYFPEAGEERFESFLAVPIRRGQNRIGVLVVQHEGEGFFSAIQGEVLKTIAAQLAGVVGLAWALMTMDAEPETMPVAEPSEAECFLRGTSASPGVVEAPVLVIRSGHSLLADVPADRFHGSAEALRQAQKETTRQLRELQEALSRRLPESAALIFDAHFMILRDNRFFGEMLVRTEAGTPAPTAVRHVAQSYIQRFKTHPDPYMREKAVDMEDLARRLLHNLRIDHADTHGPAEGHIVIARELFPSDILRFSVDGVTGIVLVGGGVTSHVSILSRSLGIPLVVSGRSELLALGNDTPALLDADAGCIYLRPDDRVRMRYAGRHRSEALARRHADAMTPETHTRDGVRVHLLANINLLSEVPLAVELKAEGIGLYRSEFPFLIRSTIPTEEEQHRIYSHLFRSIGPRWVSIRTLDAGGEKALSGMDPLAENNPELGMRAIRLTLRHPELMMRQLAAILTAAADHPRTGILFPMVSSLEEFARARQMVDDTRAALTTDGRPFLEAPAIGVMIELPALVETVADFVDTVDFFSLGTNDLVQYMLAADRGNPMVADYYQPFHPAVLRALARVVRTVRAAGKPLTICGEMAHLPEALPFLIGIGVRRFSIDPHYLPVVQRTVAAIRSDAAEEFAGRLLELPLAEAIGREIDGFMRGLPGR